MNRRPRRTYPVYAIPETEIIPVRRIRRKTRFAKTPPIVDEPRLKSATIQTEREKPSKSAHRCLRVFTFILASFLLLISLLLLIFSLNLLVNPNMTKVRAVAIVYPQATPSSGFSGTGPTDTILVTAILGLVVGGLLFFISILSMIGLCCIRVRYYAFFFCFGPSLQAIVFLVLLGLTIFISIIGDTELQRLAYSTQITVYYYYNSTTLVRNGWDFVQYYFACCGVKTSNVDWLTRPTTGWLTTSTLPQSCCGSDSTNAGHAGRIFVAQSVPTLTGICYFGDISQPTCYNSIKTTLLVTVFIFLISVALIVLLLFILSIIILCLYRKIHQVEK